MTRIDYYRRRNAPAPNSLVVAVSAVVRGADNKLLMIRWHRHIISTPSQAEGWNQERQ